MTLFKDLTIAQLFMNAANAANLYHLECVDPNFPGRDQFPIGTLEKSPEALRYRVRVVQQHLDRILELADEAEQNTI